jgi:hypothetical protein
LTVTNLRHTTIGLADEAARELLLLLDGTRDRGQLLTKLREAFDPQQVTPDSLERNLSTLGKIAFLVK